MLVGQDLLLDALQLDEGAVGGAPGRAGSRCRPGSRATACWREASGSSRLMSAPARPMVVRVLVIWKIWPVAAPWITASEKRLSLGSSSTPILCRSRPVMVLPALGGASGLRRAVVSVPAPARLGRRAGCGRQRARAAASSSECAGSRSRWCRRTSRSGSWPAGRSAELALVELVARLTARADDDHGTSCALPEGRQRIIRKRKGCGRRAGSTVELTRRNILGARRDIESRARPLAWRRRGHRGRRRRSRGRRRRTLEDDDDVEDDDEDDDEDEEEDDDEDDEDEDDEDEDDDEERRTTTTKRTTRRYDDDDDDDDEEEEKDDEE